MLTFEEAKKIGINVCIDAIGYDFCMQHKDNATSAYGVENERMRCYVGVDDRPENLPDLWSLESFALTSNENCQFKYSACCDVNMLDGHYNILMCNKPEQL